MKKLFKSIAILTIALCMIFTTSTNIQAINAISANNIATRSATTNLALNKTATASDVESGTSFTAEKAVDGNASTRWASNKDDNANKSAKWLQIDFGKPTTFDTVEIEWEQSNVLTLQLQVSDNATDWVTLYERSSTPVSKYDNAELETPAIGRYLRINVTNYNGNWPSVSIFEAAVYNTKDTTPEVPDGNYQIYPTPQKVTNFDASVALSEEVNVIKEAAIDTATNARIDEVLNENGLQPSYSDQRVDGKTNLYIGVNGSGQAADVHPDMPKDVFIEGENKYDMHVVKVFENGDIVILGRDTNAAFFGLATLEQMLIQSPDGNLKVSTFEDFAFEKYRGIVEGYYGYPWSVEGTLSYMDYAKKYKMNSFLYGPKSDPYHLGKWDEDYPLEVSEKESKEGIRTQDEMSQYAKKSAATKVDFIWVAHPAMQKPIDFTNETTIVEGIDRLMTKFDHMYQLGVREFGIFVDDISESEANKTVDMQVYMLNQVQTKMYEKYNTPEAAPEDKVKPLFFTPAWYTTGSTGSISSLRKMRNVHADVEICFTGNRVFSSIDNGPATTFKDWIGRTPVMWWNYPVNDAEDAVFFTNPINFDYSQDANPTNIKGVLANPMNYSEASKVALFGLADYTWNPEAFNAVKNWENSFKAIIPDDPEMAAALKVAYGNLNDDFIPADVKKVISGYVPGDKVSTMKLKNKMYEIMDAITKIETLKNSDNPVYRLIVEEAQTSFNKLYDMAAAIGGAMAVTSSDDSVEQMHGYYMAQAANERLNILKNDRYKIISLEGAGENIYNNIQEAVSSNKGLKPVVAGAMAAIKDFDVTSLDTSSLHISNLAISPSDKVVVKQAANLQFTAQASADRENVNDVIWSVEGANEKTTTISKNGVLSVDKNEESRLLTVKAVSAYDSSKVATVEVTVVDREYIDPTIPFNNGPIATFLGDSGSSTTGEGMESLFDEMDTTKWCPGNKNQWAAFDLGSVKQISRWQIVGGGVEHPLYIPMDYSLQVLKDPNPSEADLHNKSYLGNSANWEIVAEYKNNKENITNYIFDTPVEGRYFRLFVANPCQPGAPYPATRIFECRIFGVDKEIVSRTHSLTIDSAIANGSITTDAAHYEEGAKVNIGVHPAEGYRLKAGSLKYNGIVIPETYFIMPAENVTLSAEFESISKPEDTTLAKSILKSAIDKATAAEASAEFKTLAPSVKALIISMHNAAQRVYDNAAATNAQCIDAWINLANALQFLDFQADKNALLILINTCNEINTDGYTGGVEEFKAALLNAQSVYDNPNALQESINDAYDRLDIAKNGLVKEEVNKSFLENMISSIKQKVGDGSKYKQDANWTTFTQALANAKAVLANEAATQAEVNAAASALSEAYTNIRLLPSEEQLAELNGFLAAMKGINRGKFSKAQLGVINQTTEKVKTMISDFDEKQFPSLQKEMADTLEMINDVEYNTSNKPVKPGETGSIPGVNPNTGDDNNVAAILLLVIVSGCGVILMRRKRHQES